MSLQCTGEGWDGGGGGGGEYAALLTDLPIAFDCLSHDLRIAKLQPYGFEMSSLRLMQSYLTCRCQIIKVNKTYSLWSVQF